MSASHHGDQLRGDPELAKLFEDQASGEAVRRYPDGRIGSNDDGQLAYLIATDHVHRVILVKFPVGVEWFGLDVESAIALRDELTRRIGQLT
ncbi:MAG: hypothetical protein AB7G28_26390 [Pirellulales bacterium]